MIESKAEILKSVILQETGAEVIVQIDASGLRNGLRVHFAGWTRQEGPVFVLRPSGLNRHVIEFHFGKYAKPCVKHIVDCLTPERNAVAWAFIQQLIGKFDVKLFPLDQSGLWIISHELKIKVTLRGVESLHGDAALEKSASEAMVPLIGAIAELLGVEDSALDTLNSTEGAIKQALIHRRERSRRSRLLCISIHGCVCKVCGLDPSTKYGSEGPRIIEVHHIEPLSELSVPKPYDPSVDLIPLCPNCHRAIHLCSPALTPDQLRKQMGIIGS